MLWWLSSWTCYQQKLKQKSCQAWRTYWDLLGVQVFISESHWEPCQPVVSPRDCHTMLTPLNQVGEPEPCHWANLSGQRVFKNFWMLKRSAEQFHGDDQIDHVMNKKWNIKVDHHTASVEFYQLVKFLSPNHIWNLVNELQWVVSGPKWDKFCFDQDWKGFWIKLNNLVIELRRTKKHKNSKSQLSSLVNLNLVQNKKQNFNSEKISRSTWSNIKLSQIGKNLGRVGHFVIK